MITPDDERRRPATGPGFSDAVSFAWGDPRAGVHGLARVGLAGSEATVVVLVATHEGPVGVVARGGLPAPADADFADLALPGLSSTVKTPLEAWTVAAQGDGAGVDLAFEALCPPVAVDPAEPAARVGGMAGYEQLCRVQGTVRAGGREHALRCLGQRSRAWGEPDWERLDSVRTLAAWLDGETGVSVMTARPAGATPDSEARWGAILDAAGTLHVDEPRLSTTYDAEGRPRRAGLELWMGEEDAAPRRVTGEAVSGSTLDLGDLRLDAAVFRWHMEGRSGVGRYDLLRRA